MQDWHLYIVRCSDGTLYTGISTDPVRRFAQHCSGRGAKRLRGQGPLELVYQAAAGDRSAATRLEYCVKRLRRSDKLALIDGRLQIRQLAAGAPATGCRAHAAG
jgi:putative endonuclease